MKKKDESRALGRGLKALLNRKEDIIKDVKGATPEEERAKTQEFYGSLLKKYVQTGERDPLIEQLLNEIRDHMKISKEEHLRLLKTFRKREKAAKKHGRDEKWDEVQSDIRSELTHLFEEFQKEEEEGESWNGEKPKSTPWMAEEGKKDVIIEPGAIPLPERTREIVKGDEERTIQAMPPPEHRKTMIKLRKVRKIKKRADEADKDDIKQKTVKDDIKKKTKVEWDEEEEKEPAEPIEAPPSASELEIIHTGEISPPPMGVIVDQPETPPETLVDSTLESTIARISYQQRKPEMTEEPVKEVEEPEEEPIEEPEPEEEVEEMEEVEEEPEPLEDSLISLRILMEEGKIDLALDMSRRLLEAEPEDTSVLNERGVLLYHIGDIDGAFDCYDKAIKIDPDSTEYRVNYAILLAGKGELDESMRTLDKVISKDPYNEDAWNNKAVVLTHAGRFREALKCLDESLRINDKSVETWLNTAIIMEKLGEFGPACECYQNVLKLDADNKVAVEGLRFCRDET
ncbi:MAG: tetratricopeptide repeat protein [Thermoplasmatota archaeon]